MRTLRRVLLVIIVPTLMVCSLTGRGLSVRAAAPSKIAFVSDGDIYVMNPDGTGLNRLTNSYGDNGAPVLSPDRRTVLFTTNRARRVTDRNIEIYGLDVARADGTPLTRLLAPGRVHVDPAFSPDGTRSLHA